MDLDEFEKQQKALRARNAVFLQGIADSCLDPANPDLEMHAQFSEFAARQRHPNGWGVAYDRGGIYRIDDAKHDNSRMGNCDYAGKLKAGDLALCTDHTGDYFHDFILVEVLQGKLRTRPGTEFSAYGGIGTKTKQLSEAHFLGLTKVGPIDNPPDSLSPAC